MNLRPNIQPRFVLGAAAVIAVLMVGSAVVELHQGREELYHLMREQAISLAEAVDQGAGNAILSMDRIEEMLIDRLLNNAFYVARQDSAGILREGDLRTIAKANDLYRINIFDRRGRRILSSHETSTEHALLPEKHQPSDYLAPILEGNVEQLIVGFKEARFEKGQRFAVAVRRLRPGGGAIVLNVDAGNLLEFRRSAGFGKLIRDLGDNAGIAYVALQDSAGIIAASGAVEELSSVRADSLILQAVRLDTTLTRVTRFKEAEVFEVIRPFLHAGIPAAVLRIGLSMDAVRATEARMLRRIIIVSLVVILLGILAVVYLMVQQSYQIVEKKYTAIRTSTGNILAQMRDGVVTLDASGVITIFNQRAGELFDVDRKEIEGQRLERITGSTGSRLMDFFAKTDGVSEVHVEPVEGGRRLLELSLSTARNETGQEESRTALVRDLTEAHRLEQEARRKDKLAAMGELASAVAHEIRNPLNAIAMIVQRFDREFVPRRGIREYKSLTHVMQNETRRVNGIVSQFLSFARPPGLRCRWLPPAEVVSHVSSLFSAQADEKGVVFRADVSGPASACLDPEQMTQALLNLLQNALDATPPGGLIALEARPGEQGVQFTVRDTGTGIPAPLLEKVFDLYFTTKPGGTGLGLGIVQRIVAQHGGTLDVRSSEDKGTTVTIEIPNPERQEAT